MKIYWINDLVSGLGMMARPRGSDWLIDDIRDLKRQGVSTLICLMEKHEMLELKIENESMFCNEIGIDFISFPIMDREIPKDKYMYVQLIKNISDKLEENKKVVVHCRMGIGRTALVCAGVLIYKGMKNDLAFDILSKTRTLETPDTDEQKEWVNSIDFEYV